MPATRIFEASLPHHYDAARRLFEQYAESLPFDLGFQGFRDELAALPGEYSPPGGAILLAERHDEAVGCVGLRRLDDATCEMKRLFVHTSQRGRQLGRDLVTAVIATARARGYTRVRLDTTPSMREARRLYESLGFREIEAYRYNPVEGATFMELALPPVVATVFVGVSLDGFIARRDGALDFLPPDGGEPHGYDEFMATVDALVIGRNTFETAASFDPWPYGNKLVIVLSTRPIARVPLGAAIERMSGDPAEIVSQLGTRGLRHLYVDGGVTIQQFLRAGLIQRLIITRVPVLIGTGVPLFGELERDIALRHVGTRQYASGLVQSEYLVDTP